MTLGADELASVLTEVRRFVRDQVVPAEETIEKEIEVPQYIRAQAAAMGLFGFALPTEYGGLGLDAVEEAQLAFELGWTTPAFRSMIGTNNAIAGQVLAQSGTPEQRRTYLPPMAAGELVASFALTEDGAGSDAAALITSATLDGDEYVINGTKQYITNAPYAGLFVVFARTTPGTRTDGVSAFLVEAPADGITIGPQDEKMGQRGAVSASMFFDDVRVPVSALLGGRSGTGFSAAMSALNRGRLHVAALCVGVADRLLFESMQHASNRKQFGHPIVEFQLVQAMLARGATNRHAARALVLEACAAFDADTADKIELAAAAKLFCSEMVGRVADDAVQIHGGAGYMRGVTAERLYRDVRLFRIYEGTSEVQLLTIAKQMRKRYAGLAR